MERGVKGAIMATIKDKITSLISTLKSIFFWGVVAIVAYFGLKKRNKTKQQQGEKL